MRGSQHDIGGDEGSAADEALVGLAGDGDVLEHGAHVGPLAKLRRPLLGVRHDPLIDAANLDAVPVALPATSLLWLLAGKGSRLLNDVVQN